MLKNIISIFLIIFVYSICCIFIYESNSKYNNSYNNSNITLNYAKKDFLASLKIDKINLHQPIYNLSSPKNNVEENVSILEGSILPDQENSIIFIAAHSGVGKIAYFNDLDKLKINDIVTLYYKDKLYKYTVFSIYEEKKNGYIHANKEKENQLILTTCSKNKNKQLVVNCIEKRA